MKSFEGYLKRKFGNDYVLLTGGGHKQLSDFILVSDNHKHYWANLSTSSNLVFNSAPSFGYILFRNRDNDASVGYCGRGSSSDDDIRLDAYDNYNVHINGLISTIKSTSRVGIGTSSPISKLDVRGDITIGTPGNSGIIGCAYTTNDTSKYNFINFMHASEDGDIIYDAGNWTSGNHVAHRFDVNNVDYALVIRNYSGYVGIGLHNPAYRLDINGTLNASSTITLNGVAVSLSGHKHAYTDITGSDTTADKALVSTTTANTLTLKLLVGNAFSDTHVLASSSFKFKNDPTGFDYGGLYRNNQITSNNGTNDTDLWLFSYNKIIIQGSSVNIKNAANGSVTINGYTPITSNNIADLSVASLTTKSKTAWGQTFWDSNGKPVNIPKRSVVTCTYVHFLNRNDDNLAGYCGRGSSESDDILLCAYNSGNVSINGVVTVGTTNVGIGISNPLSKLEVNGNITLPTTGEIYFRYGNSNETVTSSTTRIAHGAARGDTYTDHTIGDIEYLGGKWTSDGAVLGHLFRVNDTDSALAIRNDGRIGIGLTNPGYLLEVNGNAATNGKITVKCLGGAITLYYDSATIFNLGSGTSATSSSNTQGILLLYLGSTEAIRLYAHDANSWISTSGNFGIGTASPGYKLDVRGSLQCTDIGGRWSDGDGRRYSRLVFARTGNGNIELKYISGGWTDGTSARAHVFYTLGGSSEVITILNSGNVGFNKTNPAYRIDVVGDIRATNFRGALVGNADTATKLYTSRSIWSLSFDGSGDIPITVCAKMPYINFKNRNDTNTAGYCGRGASGHDGIQLCCYTTDPVSISNTSGNIYIDTSGNVGIGTQSIASKLEVAGGITIDPTNGFFGFRYSSSDSNSYDRIAKGNVRGGNPYTDSNYGVIEYTAGTWTSSNMTSHLFRTASSNQALVIKNNGYVGINTLSPGYDLDISGVTRCRYMYFWHGNNLANAGYAGCGSSSTVMLWVVNSGYTWNISIAGSSSTWSSTGLTVAGTVTSTNFYTTSDRLKKQNVSSFSEHIRKFQLKDTEKWHYGVVAQEVPEMFRDGEEGSMTVNYNSILSYYIGCLENKVKELEEKINKLENK